MHCSFPWSGTVYGLALNDMSHLCDLSAAFSSAPYKAPPLAPVLYIKPRNCLSYCGAHVVVPSELDEVQVAATVGVVLARDLSGAAPGAVRSAIGGARLALDVSGPTQSFYRPAIRQQCRDGFLPLGGLASLPEEFGDILTTIDGEAIHRWSLDRLDRAMEVAVAEVTNFMTLQAGDMLLLGLAGDAPRARAGQTITVASQGLPTLSTSLTRELS